jgi:predicted nucleic acid-binding protein
MWVIDTCIVLDILENDPEFGRASAQLLQKLLPQGLSISPITTVELSVVFSGDIIEQKYFLDQAGISYVEAWTAADIERACTAWNFYIVAKRQAQTPKRPVADILAKQQMYKHEVAALASQQLKCPGGLPTFFESGFDHGLNSKCKNCFEKKSSHISVHGGGGTKSSRRHRSRRRSHHRSNKKSRKVHRVRKVRKSRPRRHHHCRPR